ncbi:hypothetical protein KSP39_PZI019024 [Platanthera zijinensis]|uniref:DVL n=1 Tax=Platanthera zijinensis TaxID=2320716 RepID=A0AAP0B2I7_9ASPA
MDEKWKLSKNKSSSRNSRISRQEEETRTVAGSDDGQQPSFTSRCTNVVKEQRSRFYILRRCVKMLVCWRDYP